ncbi:hypothetical protein P9112_001002 [Eukaryota sp. TZLM1-RC]
MDEGSIIQNNYYASCFSSGVESLNLTDTLVDNELDLSYVSFEEPHVTFLMTECIKYPHFITSLSLKSTDIDPITPFLHEFKSLRSLSLSCPVSSSLNSYLASSPITHLSLHEPCNAFFFPPNLSSFTLTSSQLSDQFLSHLLSLLPQCIEFISIDCTQSRKKTLSLLESSSFRLNHLKLAKVELKSDELDQDQINKIEAIFDQRGHNSMTTRDHDVYSSFDCESEFVALEIIKSTEPLSRDALLSLGQIGSRISELSRTCRQLYSEVSVSKQSNSTAFSALNSVLIHRDSLENKCQEMEQKLKTTINNLIRDNEALKTELECYQEMIEIQNKTIEGHNVDVTHESTQTDREPVNVGCQSCQNIQIKLNKSKDLLKECRTQQENIEVKCTAANELCFRQSKMINELQSENVRLKDELLTCSSSHSKLVKEFDRLYRDYDRVVVGNQELEAQNSEFSIKVKETLEENRNLNDFNDCLQHDSYNQSIIIDRLRSQIEQHETTVLNYQDVISALRHKLDFLNNF